MKFGIATLLVGSAAAFTPAARFGATRTALHATEAATEKKVSFLSHINGGKWNRRSPWISSGRCCSTRRDSSGGNVRRNGRSLGRKAIAFFSWQPLEWNGQESLD